MPQYWSSSRWREDMEGWKTNGPPQLPSPPLGRPRLRKWSLQASCKWRSFDAPNCAWNSHWSYSMRGFHTWSLVTCKVLWYHIAPHHSQLLGPCVIHWHLVRNRNPPQFTPNFCFFYWSYWKSGEKRKVESGPVESHLQAPAWRFTKQLVSKSCESKPRQSPLLPPSSCTSDEQWKNLSVSALSSLICLFCTVSEEWNRPRRPMRPMRPELGTGCPMLLATYQRNLGQWSQLPGIRWSHILLNSLWFFLFLGGRHGVPSWRRSWPLLFLPCLWPRSSKRLMFSRGVHECSLSAAAWCTCMSKLNLQKGQSSKVPKIFCFRFHSLKRFCFRSSQIPTSVEKQDAHVPETAVGDVGDVGDMWYLLMDLHSFTTRHPLFALRSQPTHQAMTDRELDHARYARFLDHGPNRCQLV